MGDGKAWKPPEAGNEGEARAAVRRGGGNLTAVLCEAVRCAIQKHNALHAEETFDREHMARYRRREPRTGESTIAGERALPVTSAAARPTALAARPR